MSNDVFTALAVAQGFYKATAPQVKRDAGGVREEADNELYMLYQSHGARQVELMLPDGRAVGTLSGSITKPKPPETASELRVTDRAAFAEWVAANGPLLAQWLEDDDEAARGAAGYAFTVAGEQPAGCEFVEFVTKPGDPGGQWRTVLRVDEGAVMEWAAAQIAQGRNPLALPGGEDAEA